MEVFSVLLMAVILLILIMVRDQAGKRFDQLENELRKIKELLAKAAVQSIKPVEEERAATPAKEWKSNFKIVEEPVIVPELIVQQATIKEEPVAIKIKEVIEEPLPFVQKHTAPHVEEKLKPTFFERNPDM